MFNVRYGHKVNIITVHEQNTYFSGLGASFSIGTTVTVCGEWVWVSSQSKDSCWLKESCSSSSKPATVAGGACWSVAILPKAHVSELDSFLCLNETTSWSDNKRRRYRVLAFIPAAYHLLCFRFSFSNCTLRNDQVVSRTLKVHFRPSSDQLVIKTHKFQVETFNNNNNNNS